MALTLSNTFYSRGLCADFKIAKFNNGGTSNVYYRNYTNSELFDDAPTVGDYILFYASAPFSGFEAVNLSSVIAAASHNLTYQYWNGTAWTSFTGLTDGTNQLTQNGQIAWTQPTDWETIAANNGNASKSGGYAVFALKVTLTAFSGFTEGGYLTGYQKIRQKYLNFNDGGSHTPASMYADDVAGSWGVVTKKGDYAYDISCGVYFGNCTFTFNSTKIQIGDAGSPNYVPFKVYNCTMACNDSSVYLSSSLGSALIVYSKGNGGTITFYPTTQSKFYNLYLAQPYDTHYSRFATYSYGGVTQCKWYNVFIGSMMYTGGSHNFRRMNFQNIQYLLSAGDTIYDSCIFGTKFNKDPGYAPVVLRPVFDGGGGSTSDWIGMYYPDSLTRQHHFDAISGQWTKANKWKCYADDAYPTSLQRSHIHIYSNFLNIKIEDEYGNKLSGAKLSITDKHENGALWEDLDVYFTSSPSDVNDTSLTVDDASGLSVADIILWWGEVMVLLNIIGNVLTVSRGNENSARGFNFNDRFVPLRRRIAEMTIDEKKDEIYIQERTYYKYTTDGGVTSTGNVHTDYPPLALKVKLKGYETFNAVIPFNEADDNINRSGEVFMTAIMKRVKINIDTEVIS